jgi:signal transduction histidine kinase
MEFAFLTTSSFVALNPQEPVSSQSINAANRSAVLVVVRDSGVGLSREEIAGVFEAFYTTKPEGMGMGLWICRAIIEAHGGELTAQRNDGAGATFQFFLPATPGGAT